MTMTEWKCPACQWVQKAHPAYGWSVRDSRAVEVHETMLCKGWTPCTYGDPHPASLTFTWVNASGDDGTEHQTHVCDAHAKHVHARVTAPRDTHGRPYLGAQRPGIVVLRVERAA